MVTKTKKKTKKAAPKKKAAPAVTIDRNATVEEAISFVQAKHNVQLMRAPIVIPPKPPTPKEALRALVESAPTDIATATGVTPAQLADYVAALNVAQGLLTE